MNEEFKTTLITLILSTLFGLVLYGALALAQPSGPSSITVASSSRADISNSAVAVEAQAGNVTSLDIAATRVTTGWQGYFGDISGSFTLSNSVGDVFYNWSGLGSVSGEVYASRNDSVDWSSINCTNSSQFSDEEIFLGKVAGDADSLTNTFNQTNHPEFFVGSVNVSTDSCNSTNAFIDTGQSTTDYYQVLLADGNNDVVYTALIDDGQVGFDGSNHDFQLLVGENGNATQTGTTTYYFYIELS